MLLQDFSDFIESLKNKQKLTYKKLGEELYMSPQSVHNWFKRRKNVDWKLNSIITLSRLMKFDFLISNGNLYVKENEIMNNQQQTLKFAHENEISKLYKNIVLDNGKKATYEIVKDLGDYSIVKFYTPTENINYDTVPSLLEDYFYHNTIDECLDAHPYSKNIIHIYGLINNETGYIEHENFDTSIFLNKIENRYLFAYAKPIETTIDGFDIVHIDKENNLKFIKAYAEIEDIYYDKSVSIKKLTPDEPTGNYLYIIAAININENSIANGVICAANLEEFYKENNMKEYAPRYFDGIRTEILDGYTIKKTGYTLDFLSDEDFEDDDFEENTVLEVIAIKNVLFYKENTTTIKPLSDLNLLKWTIINK